MCIDSFVAVDPTGLDKEEFERHKLSLQIAASTNLLVRHGLMYAAEEDGTIRNWLESIDEGWENWIVEIKCGRCDRWRRILGIHAVDVAAACVAKQMLENIETANDEDISEYILS